MKSYPITPVAAPRMMRSDKWKKRKCVLQYRAFRDEVRLRRVTLPVPYKVTFWMPMPLSWSAKKRSEWAGKPHMNKPDKDNLEKALLDSIYKDDSVVWSGWVEKRWAETGAITVENLNEEHIRRVLET